MISGLILFATLVLIAFGLPAVFAILYTLVVGILIYRKLTWHQVITAMSQTLNDIGMIMLVILFCGSFGYVITFERVPQGITEFALTAFNAPTVLLFAVVGVLLVLGMLVEATVMMTQVTFGGMTPPVGVSICAVCGIQCCSHKDYTVKSLPVVAAVLIAVVIVILFPQVVLFLPTMLM